MICQDSTGCRGWRSHDIKKSIWNLLVVAIKYLFCLDIYILIMFNQHMRLWKYWVSKTLSQEFVCDPIHSAGTARFYLNHALGVRGWHGMVLRMFWRFSMFFPIMFRPYFEGTKSMVFPQSPILSTQYSQYLPFLLVNSSTLNFLVSGSFCVLNP